MRATQVVAATAFSLSLASCAESISPSAVPGLYTLVTVDGEPLPYVIRDTVSMMVEIVGADLNLREDNASFMHTYYRITRDGLVSTETRDDWLGWSVDGTTITVENGAVGVRFTGTKSDDTLRLMSRGVEYVFEK